MLAQSLFVLAATLPALAMPQEITPANSWARPAQNYTAPDLQGRYYAVKCGNSDVGMPAKEGYTCCSGSSHPPYYCSDGKKCQQGIAGDMSVMYTCKDPNHKARNLEDRGFPYDFGSFVPCGKDQKGMEPGGDCCVPDGYDAIWCDAGKKCKHKGTDAGSNIWGCVDA